MANAQMVWGRMLLTEQKTPGLMLLKYIHFCMYHQITKSRFLLNYYGRKKILFFRLSENAEVFMTCNFIIPP